MTIDDRYHLFITTWTCRYQGISVISETLRKSKFFKRYKYAWILPGARFNGTFPPVHNWNYFLATCFNPSPVPLISLKKRERQVILAGFAVCRSAFRKIIPEFCRLWYNKTGEMVRFVESYGGSGAQSRAVLEGLPAHVIMLALGADMERVAEAGLLDEHWERSFPNNSIVTQSVTILVVREGNPKGIKGFDDLIRDDIDIVLTNPKSAGVARWNFLALWAYKVFKGCNEADRRSYVWKVFRNAPYWCKDGRDSSALFFLQNQGDVLITYENEVLLACMLGESVPYIVPTVNCLIENPIAVVARNAEEDGVRDISEAFVSFCFERTAQRSFASVGFRPVHPEIKKQSQSLFPSCQKLYKVADFGGWKEATRKFFGVGSMFDQIEEEIALDIKQKQNNSLRK